MVELKEQQIFINNQSVILLAGEIHYFRLKRKDWQKALDGLIEAGGNTVSTYIPWICHEYKENDLDFTGIYHEENDLLSFIELVKENDLYFIARPGPFVMAELKNEGIPYWVFDADKDILPITWDERITYNKTCDYLNPTYLKKVHHWYSHVLPLLEKFSFDNGGPMIALQLDNEIGMLSWVCNCPDLTDIVCEDFIAFIQGMYESDEIKRRYGFEFKALDYQRLRSPSEEYALVYHYDLGLYMRFRTKKYCEILTKYTEEFGIKNIPLIINIHGSGGHRAFNYPIGLSQLMDAMSASANYLPGSDMYIGNVDLGNFQDLYVANMFARSLSLENQPLSSMEFEGCAGDYDNNFNDLTEPQAIDIKTRLFISLGNKMINYYLFCGGENYRIDDNLHDGNGRIAITGQKHGYKAPLGPDANKNVCYDSVANVMNLVKANSKHLAACSLKVDNVTYGFIPDYYMTEFCYPNSDKQHHLHNEIKKIRDNGALNIVARSLILNNYSFKVANLQDKNQISSINTMLVVTMAKYLACNIQQSIVQHIKQGRNVILYGSIPLLDMEGNECTILRDFLNIRVKKDFQDLKLPVCSVYPDGRFVNYSEVRSGIGETLDVSRLDKCEVILREYESKDCCGYIGNYDKAKVCVISTYFNCNLEIFDNIYQELGAKRNVSYLPKYYGTYSNMFLNKFDEGYINVFNLDGYVKEEYLRVGDNNWFDVKLRLENKKCVMLPYNLKVSEQVIIIKALAEYYGQLDGHLIFRPFQTKTLIQLKKNNEIIDYVFTTLEEIRIKIN